MVTAGVVRGGYDSPVLQSLLFDILAHVSALLLISVEISHDNYSLAPRTEIMKTIWIPIDSHLECEIMEGNIVVKTKARDVNLNYLGLNPSPATFSCISEPRFLQL
jgi:hypothetical protein